MKQILNHIFNRIESGKYLSLFTVFLLTFALVGDTRRYIFDHICKAQNMMQIGAPWLNVSAFAAGMAVVGIVAGLTALYFTRKKLTFPVIEFMDVICGLFAIVILFITPYTLQLTAPEQNLQNLSVIATFAVILFSAIAVALSVYSAGAHILIALRDDERYAAQMVSFAAVVAVLPSILCAALGGSYRFFVGIVGLLLLIFGSLGGFLGKREVLYGNGEATFEKNGKVAFGIFLFALAAVIVAVAATVEHLVKF